MSILLVYNTCGIHQERQQPDFYLQRLEDLLNQKVDARVVWSSCLNTNDVREKLKSHFQDRISYNFVDEILPVNVTFNSSVLNCVKHFGKFESYTYIDSGVSFIDHNTIQKLWDLMRHEPRIGMVCGQADTDSGLFHLGLDHIPEDVNLVIPVGKAMHPHVNMWHNDILNFYDRLIPDIFASFCTESTYTFIVAALQKWWVACGAASYKHWHEMEGASSGFQEDRIRALTEQQNKHQDGRGTWDHTFRSPKSMFEIISDPKAIEYGFGYEECAGVLMHNPLKYSEEGFCLNEDLKYFIKDNLYLKSNKLDYNNIRGIFIK